MNTVYTFLKKNTSDFVEKSMICMRIVDFNTAQISLLKHWN